MSRRSAHFLAVALVLAAATVAGPAPAAGTEASWPTDGWTTTNPESVGLAPEPLEHLVTEARAGRFRDLHSLILVKDGRLVLEEYLPGGAREQLHTAQSVTKSVTATLVGVAIERGLIAGTDASLLDFFPQYDEILHLDDRKRAITLEDVLRMRIGLAWREQGIPHDSPENSLHRLNGYDGDWYRLVLDTPMDVAPGERYAYNSGGTILLAGVLERATGQRADLFARDCLFEPLGIRSFYWTVVRGVPHTGGGLSMSARDLAKLGYLHLRDGVWDGRRLLPEGWVALATTGRLEAPQPGAMPISYGYLWWLLPAAADTEKESADAAIYAAWGYMGQFVFVVPAHDLVFVTTGGATDFADETRPFELLYDWVLPAADPSLEFIPPQEEEASAGEERAASEERPSIPTFERTFGGPNADRGIAVATTADGGYVVTGTTMSFGAGDEDAYLIRTDAVGEPVFTRVWGGPGEDCGWSVHETVDGGFVVAGFTESFGAGALDAWLIRTDAAGDTLWTRTYGGAGNDLVWSALPLPDGGLALAGQTDSRGAGDFDFWLLRTDADGHAEWERTYGGPAVDRAFSVQPTQDGGFVLGGITYSFGAGGRDGWVVKTDGAGNEVWARALGSEGYDVIHAVCATREPGCLAIGYSSGLGTHGGQDGWVLKLAPDGRTEWTSIFGGARDDRILNGVQMPDGDCVVGGFTASSGAGGLDVYLVRLGPAGGVEWARSYGGRGEDSGYGLTATGDGGVLVTGLTKSIGAGEADLYLVKTDGHGVP